MQTGERDIDIHSGRVFIYLTAYSLSKSLGRRLIPVFFCIRIGKA